MSGNQLSVPYHSLIYELKMEEMHIKNSKKLPKSNNMSSKAPPAQNNLREILDRIGTLS